MRTTTTWMPLLMIVGLLGCSEEQDSVDVTTSAVYNGTTSTAYPEIGSVLWPVNQLQSGFCTGTLIASRWVLTAAHCITFSTANPTQYHFYAGSGSTTAGAGATADAVFNFAPGASVGGLSGGCTNCKVTPDHTGTNDIALLHLGSDVSAGPGVTLSTPRFNLAIDNAGNPIIPHVGDSMRLWGFGQNQNANDWGVKRVASWTYSTPTNYAFYTDGGLIREGDSGGPVFAFASYGGVSMPIFGVNSVGTQGAFTTDQFGSVSDYGSSLCSTMINYPHSPCRVGAPLSSLPWSCGYHSASNKVPSTMAENIVGYVCQDNYNGNPPEDPYCCSTAWDSQCVAEAQQAMTAADWNTCLASP